MVIYSKNTLFVALLLLLPLSGFAQQKPETPQNLTATYREFKSIRLDWKAKLVSGESIEIYKKYEKDQKETIIPFKDSKNTFIETENLKEGDYFYQIRKVAANGKTKSEWSNLVKGAILIIALETPKIKNISTEYNDRIEIAYENTLKEGETLEFERRGRDTDKGITTTFTTAFEAIQLEQLPDGSLVDKNVDARIGKYQYRIRIVDKNGNKSEWSEPVIGRVIPK